MFIKGKLAFFFGYSYFIPQINAQAPKLNYSIAKLPQIEGNQESVNFANYWVESVSTKSKHKNEAWDFVQFMTKADQVKPYLNRVQKPSALRTVLKGQFDDPRQYVWLMD